VVQVVGGYPASTRRMRVSTISASSKKLGEGTGKSTSWMLTSSGRVRSEVTPVRRRLVSAETENLGTTAGPVRETLAEGLVQLRSSWICRARRSWVEGTKERQAVSEDLEVLYRKLHSLRIRSMLPKVQCRSHETRSPTLGPFSPFRKSLSFNFALRVPNGLTYMRLLDGSMLRLWMMDAAGLLRTIAALFILSVEFSSPRSVNKPWRNVNHL